MIDFRNKGKQTIIRIFYQEEKNGLSFEVFVNGDPGELPKKLKRFIAEDYLRELIAKDHHND